MTENLLLFQVNLSSVEESFRSYTVASEGNISVRLADGFVMITPTKVIKDFITEDDLVVVDMDGNHVDGSRKATTERFTHLAIYKRRHDIDCIVHAHPVYTVLSTVLGEITIKYTVVSLRISRK